MSTPKHLRRTKLTGALAVAVIVGSSFAPAFALDSATTGDDFTATATGTATPSVSNAAATAAETPQNDPGAERNATNTTGVIGGFAFSDADENGVVRFNYNGIWGGGSVEGQRVADDHWMLDSPSFELKFANPITALTVQNAYKETPVAVPLEVGTQLTIQDYFWDKNFGPGIAPDIFEARISAIETTVTGGTLVSFETLTPGYLPGSVTGNITEAEVDDEVINPPVITPTGEAFDDSYTTKQGQAVEFDVAANDTTTEGFHAEQFKLHFPGTAFAATNWTDEHGNFWVIDSATGKGTLTPTADFTGNASASYSWALKSSDPEAGPNSYGLFGAKVNVDVTPVLPVVDAPPVVDVPPVVENPPTDTPTTPTPSDPPVVPTPEVSTPTPTPVVPEPVPVPTPSDPPVVDPPTVDVPVVPENPVVPVNVPEEPVVVPDVPVEDDGGDSSKPPVLEDDGDDTGTTTTAALADTGAGIGGLFAGVGALLAGGTALLGFNRKKAKPVKVDA